MLSKDPLQPGQVFGADGVNDNRVSGSIFDRERRPYSLLAIGVPGNVACPKGSDATPGGITCQVRVGVRVHDLVIQLSARNGFEACKKVAHRWLNPAHVRRHAARGTGEVGDEDLLFQAAEPLSRRFVRTGELEPSQFYLDRVIAGELDSRNSQEQQKNQASAPRGPKSHLRFASSSTKALNQRNRALVATK